MDEIIKREKDINEVRLMPPLVLAYIGDSIYDLYIRNTLVQKTKLHPHELHVETIKYVKAKAQCKILKDIEDKLTEDEKDIVRRGRNADSHHLPKNVNIHEYMYATAFETLIGYLYLSKQDKRLGEILSWIL